MAKAMIVGSSMKQIAGLTEKQGAILEALGVLESDGATECCAATSRGASTSGSELAGAGRSRGWDALMRFYDEKGL